MSVTFSVLFSILGLCGLAFGLRARRRARTAELLTNTIPQLVYVGDSQGRCIFLNEHWTSYTGLSQKELFGVKWRELIHPEDLPGMLKERDRTRELGIAFEYRARLRRHDGEYRWFVVQSYPGRDRGGKIDRWYGTYTDIHDQVLARKDLEVAKERLEHVLAASNIGIWEVDFATGRVSRSDQHDRLYGYSQPEAEWTYQRFMNAIHIDDRDGVREHIERVARSTESTYSGEFRIVWPDGSVHWLSSRARYIRDANGVATHVRGLIWDVTDLKNAQEEAEAAARVKSQFLANVSHELRTPLGAILGFQKMLRDSSLSAAERETYNEIVERNGQALLRLIDDVLDISRVEAGALGIEVSPIKLTAAVTDLVHAFDPQLRASGNSLDVHFEGAMPATFVSDPHRFRQILTNLISNAIKFTQAGGIRLVVGTLGDMLTFDVADNGAGIAPHVQNSLFKPFRQGDETITRRYGGTGLGLALSRELARALGGDLVLLDSAPGVGSRFRLTLPLVEGINVAPLERAPVAQAIARPLALTGYKILVVDDSPDNQLLMRRALNRVGADVAIANNGLEGVDLAMAEDFDVVLMDMQMPVMDGETATRHLRACGYARPIFALTAHALKEQREASLRMGCTAHVTKPVDFGRLIEQISNLAPLRTDVSSRDAISETSRTTHTASAPPV